MFVLQNCMNSLALKIVTYADECTAIQRVRTEVFQVEQGVSPELEFDGLDETSTHLLAYWENEAVGTARIRQITPELAKIERVAVLSTHRGRRIGNALMEEAIAYLMSQGIATVKLSSQLHAQAFYEKLGFVPQGEVFEEAGIPHIDMQRTLLGS